MKVIVLFLLGLPIELLPAAAAASKPAEEVKQEASGQKIQAAQAARRHRRHHVREFEHERPGHALLELVSAQGGHVSLPREIAQHPWISKFLANTLDNDKDAHEVPVPGVDTNTLRTMVYFMKELREVITNLPKKSEDEAEPQAREITWRDIDTLGLGMQSVRKATTFEELPALINAANYLDSPMLFHEFIERYVATLSEQAKRSGDPLKFLVDELQKQRFGRGVLDAVAWMYYLDSGIDLDDALGIRRKVSIDSNNKQMIGIVDLIERMGGISDEDIAAIKKDPNTILPFIKRPVLTEAAMSGHNQLVYMLLKLPNIDVHAGDPDTPLWAAVEYNNIHAARVLLAHGADPQMGHVVYRAAIKAPAMLELILSALRKPNSPKQLSNYLRELTRGPLVSALHDGLYRNALMLINAGADIDQLGELAGDIPFQPGTLKLPEEAAAYQELIDRARKQGKENIAARLERLRKDLANQSPVKTT